MCGVVGKQVATPICIFPACLMLEAIGLGGKSPIAATPLHHLCSVTVVGLPDIERLAEKTCDANQESRARAEWRPLAPTAAMLNTGQCQPQIQNGTIWSKQLFLTAIP